MNTNTITLKDEIKSAEQLFATIAADKRDIITGILIGMELAEQCANRAEENKTA